MIPHPPCIGYTVILTPTASKILSKLNKQTISAILDKLKQLTFGRQNLDIKKLKNSKTLYRLRVGNYRVIYQIAHSTITIHVVEIGHRKEVYR